MLLLIYGVGLPPNPARKPEKTWQKVAETAKIPKTAPKTQP